MHHNKWKEERQEGEEEDGEEDEEDEEEEEEAVMWRCDVKMWSEVKWQKIITTSALRFLDLKIAVVCTELPKSHQ